MKEIKTIEDLRFFEQAYDIYSHTHITCNGSILINDGLDGCETIEKVMCLCPSFYIHDIMIDGHPLDIIMINDNIHMPYDTVGQMYVMENITNYQNEDMFCREVIRINSNVIKEAYQNMSIKTLLDNLDSTTKRKEKEEILHEYASNKDKELMCEIFFLALDPFVQFNIKKIPKYVSSSSPKYTLSDAIKVIRSELLLKRKRGNESKNIVSELLSNLTKDEAVVLERIIKKDLRCGVAGKTINKVLGQTLVSEYPCMLGRPYNEKSIKNIRWPAYSQSKADGVRVNVHITNSKETCFSRAGREMHDVGEYFSEEFKKIKRILYNKPYVLDGELLVTDNNGGILDRKTGNGIINKAIKGTATKEEISRFKFVLWDIIPFNSFTQGETTESPYRERFNILVDAIDELDSSSISVIDNRIVHNFKEAEIHFQECLSQGKEGTVLKNITSEWVGKRCNDLIKFKAELDCDLEITGWNEGNGQFKGMVGSLICESRDRTLMASISGFPVKFRKELSDNIQDYIGKIITVKYNEVIKSKVDKSKYSLFLPRFVEVREDKTEADLTKNIK